MQFHTHIHFNGQCEEAFRFYERTLGARIESLLLYEGTPAASQTAPEWHKKVIHGRININGQTLMACDCPAECYTRPQGFSVSLTVKNSDEAERLFQALAEDGSVQMPLQETFWAVRFGMATDRFGIPWMINCEKARVELESPENRYVTA